MPVLRLPHWSWGCLVDLSWMQDAKDHLPKLVARTAGAKWNSKHPQGPIWTSSCIFLERELPIPLFSSMGLCFLRLLWKCTKINQKSSLRRVPVTSLSALLLKFQKEHSDSMKCIQLLVKLMSYCHTFKETLISSQRAGVSLSRARGKLGAWLHLAAGCNLLQKLTAELPEEENGASFPCFGLRSFVPGFPTLCCLEKLPPFPEDAGRSLRTWLHFQSSLPLSVWQILFCVF